MTQEKKQLKNQSLNKGDIKDGLAFPWSTFAIYLDPIEVGNNAVLFVVDEEISDEWLLHPSLSLRLLSSVRKTKPEITSISFTRTRSVKQMTRYGHVTALKGSSHASQ
jgi:hypothetical protein